MLNSTQIRILEELYSHADPREIAEKIVDLFEGWDTNPENQTATPCERAEYIYIMRKLAAFFRKANEHHHAGKANVG